METIYSIQKEKLATLEYVKNPDIYFFKDDIEKYWMSLHILRDLYYW